MSMTRLCVRSSNWSRASLSECGETSSVKRSILVGSGTGPLTVAPVRLAVSTISLEELSINRWSKALRRMRMFWLAISCSFLKSDQVDSYLANVFELVVGRRFAYPSVLVFEGVRHHFAERNGARPRFSHEDVTSKDYFKIFAT